MSEFFGGLKVNAIWTMVALGALIAAAAFFLPALLGLGFVAVLLFALWRTRDRMGWAQALAALAVLALCALIFWRAWAVLAMLVVIAVLTLRATRLPRTGESSS